MGKIKAGVVVVTEFCRPNDNRFQGYIDYINRSKAVRNKNTAKYNLYQDYWEIQIRQADCLRLKRITYRKMKRCS